MQPCRLLRIGFWTHLLSSCGKCGLVLSIKQMQRANWKVFITADPMIVVFMEGDSVEKYYTIDDNGSAPYLSLEPSASIDFKDGTAYFGVNGIDPV